MANRKAIESDGDDEMPNPDGVPGRLNVELPFVASPSVAPAAREAVPQAATETPLESCKATAPDLKSLTAAGVASAPAASADVQTPKRPFSIARARRKRQALLAASVAIAAAVGAVVGAAATGAFSRPAMVETAAEESKATQQSVAHLAIEITNLKASLDAVNKAANNQIAKIGERLNRESTGVTSSTTPPQTVPPVPQASPPGPPPSTRTVAEPHPSRLPVVLDWSIRETRDGYIYVQGHGDIYQVVPGAPLPGLGPVERVKRQDGRWVVVTPKGIIVSMRDRRYFEQF